jgi:hypothetical protein
MKTLAHSPAAAELHCDEAADAPTIAGGDFILRATEDGWSLVTLRGELVYRGLGVHARHRCLQIAYERGALVVLS